MSEQAGGTSFRLAPMSPLIATVTVVLLALPIALLAGALLGTPQLAVPAVLMAAVYVWVWLRFRPTRFELHGHGLRVIWPLKRCDLSRSDIASVRVIDRRSLKDEIGWGLRVGAGGLWGGFGWLWTKRRGIIRIYATRTDRFVWIERLEGRPWLITPERPEAFVRALTIS